MKNGTSKQNIENSESYRRSLQIAFIAGAIVDGLAVIPFLSAPLFKLSFGIDKVAPITMFVSGTEANSLLCWTILLLWALRSPIERAFIAPLTLLAIFGLIAAEIIAVVSGTIAMIYMAPTWCAQAFLLALYIPVSIEYFSKRRFGNRPLEESETLLG